MFSFTTAQLIHAGWFQTMLLCLTNVQMSLLMPYTNVNHSQQLLIYTMTFLRYCIQLVEQNIDSKVSNENLLDKLQSFLRIENWLHYRTVFVSHCYWLTCLIYTTCPDSTGCNIKVCFGFWNRKIEGRTDLGCALQDHCFCYSAL